MHPKLTMTGMYNVLEKLRTGEPLTKKEQLIHEQGLVSVLKQIHDDLAAAVFAAYGWPGTLSDEEILERLVALNHERAAEEEAGKIRWLRPEFQNPLRGAVGADSGKTQLTLTEEDEEEESDKGQGASAKGKKKPAKEAKAKAGAVGKLAKAAWPTTLPDRIRAVRQALTTHAKPATADDIASHFTRAHKPTITELLETLVAVGQARVTKGGKFVG